MRGVRNLRDVMFLVVCGCLLAVGLVALAVASIEGAGDGWPAHHGGVRGTFTVTDCQLHRSRQLAVWDCPGNFRF